MQFVKRIKNNTASPKTWHGQEIEAETYYQIQPLEEIPWANDSELLAAVVSGEAIVNDGTSDILNINDAVDYLKNGNPVPVNLLDPTDKSKKTTVAGGRAYVTLADAEGDVMNINPDGTIPFSLSGATEGGSGTSTILRQKEISVATKVETDLPDSTYTVPAGKKFKIVTFGGCFDIMSPMYVRIKKQVGGAGAWTTMLRITLKIHGQDESNFQQIFPNGLLIGNAGDVIKITYESALAKGTFWGGYTGVEY